jgi:hypothetical protein
VFSTVHPSYVDRYFRLRRSFRLIRLKHVDCYLGSDRSDDLRDPDPERSNQRVAACAAHAPSLCFSWAKPSVNMSKVLISRFDNALLLLFLPHPDSCVPDFSFLRWYTCNLITEWAMRGREVRSERRVTIVTFQWVMFRFLLGFPDAPFYGSIGISRGHFQQCLSVLKGSKWWCSHQTHSLL